MVLEVKLMAVDRQEMIVRRHVNGVYAEVRRVQIEPFETIVLRDNEEAIFPTPPTRPCGCGRTLSPWHECDRPPGAVQRVLAAAMAYARSRVNGRPTTEAAELRAAVAAMEGQ